MANIIVSSPNPNTHIFNISYNDPAAPQGQQNTQLYESISNIDSNELREFNVADIWKDSISTNTQVNMFKPLYGAINQLFGDVVLNGPPNSAPRPTWQNKLDDKKNLIKRIIPTNEYEVVFERTKVKTQTELLTVLNFYESGIGVEKILNPIVLAQARTIKNPAQALDAGPSGAGNYVFPKLRDTLTFTEYFMTSYGFQNEEKPIPDPVTEDNPLGFPGGWSWTATTLQDQSQGLKGFHFIIDLWLTDSGAMRLNTALPADLARINQLILGNAVKNNDINITDITNPAQLERAALLVAFKELGDAMMNAVYISYFYYIQQRYQTAREVYEGEGYGECPEHICEISSNQLANLYLTMYTCDATVHYRNVLYGVPSVLTGSKNKVNFGLIYKPTAMPESERLTNLLDIEFNTIINNNIELKSRLVQSRESLWILNPSRNNRLKNIGLSLDQAGYGRDLINLLNAEVVRLKDAILIGIQQNLVDNAQFLIRINEMKQYLCSPFIVPRFIPGERERATTVQRGCLVDFIIINSVWPDGEQGRPPIKGLARGFNNILLAAIGQIPVRGGSGDKGFSDRPDDFVLAVWNPNVNNNLLFEGYTDPTQITSLTMNEQVIWNTLLNIFPSNNYDRTADPEPWSIEGYSLGDLNNIRGTYPFLSIIYMLYCRSVWYLQIMTNVNAICGNNYDKDRYIQCAIYYALDKSSYFDLTQANCANKTHHELILIAANGFPHVFDTILRSIFLKKFLPERNLIIKPQLIISDNFLRNYFSFVFNEDGENRNPRGYVSGYVPQIPAETIPISNTPFQFTPHILWQPALAQAPPLPPPAPVAAAAPGQGVTQGQKRRFQQQLYTKQPSKIRAVNFGPKPVGTHQRRQAATRYPYGKGGTKRKNVYRKRNNNKYTKKNMKKYTNKSVKYPKIVKKTRKTRKTRKNRK